MKNLTTTNTNTATKACEHCNGGIHCYNINSPCYGELCGIIPGTGPIITQDEQDVFEAIYNTKKMLPKYWQKTLEQRLGSSGSCYPEFNSSDTLEEALQKAHWEKTSHPAVMEGCNAYKSNDFGLGIIGIVKIDDLDDSVKLTATDPKKTGFISMSIAAAKVSETLKETSETWLITGEEEGETVVFTFHPGEPIRPSSLEVGSIKVGDRVSKREAKTMGFDFAKVVWD